MTIRSIVQASESSLEETRGADLRSLTTIVDLSNLSEATQVVEDLLDTMSSQALCVGLAANQIGSHLRVAVVQIDDENPLVLLNPVLISATGKKDKKRESCMSIWGYTAEVERRAKIVVAYDDLNLAHREEAFEGFLARVIQHEVDHLDGVLYVDIATGPAGSTPLFDQHSPSVQADGL